MSEQRYSSQSLLIVLEYKAALLKRAPTWHDVTAWSKAGQGPSPRTYIRRFGSLGAALRKVGLSSRRHVTVDLPSVVEGIQRMEAQLGRSATRNDYLRLYKEFDLPSLAAVRAHVGTWRDLSKLVRAAGPTAATAAYVSVT